MANEKDMNEFNPEIYTLIDEEGVEQAFELLDVMEIDDQTYFALVPYFENPEDSLSDDGDLVILKAQEIDGEELMASIDDDDEYEMVGNLFIDRLENLFESMEDEDEE